MFLRQIFTIGIFHADPHPGNILIEPDGTIVLIDLGAVGRLGAGHREAVLDMLAAASMGNAAGLRQALSQITLFDSVGFATEDFSAQRYVHDKIRGTNLYQNLDLRADSDDPRDLFGMLDRRSASLKVA